MYPPGNDQPARDIAPGDRIEHKLMPGFVMEVRGVKECQADGARPEPHMQYMITDPDDCTDWLCGYDVRKAGKYEGA
jgi:hypothetical protein